MDKKDIKRGLLGAVIVAELAVLDYCAIQLMKNGLKCLDIELIDHVIIADGEFYSFAEEQVTKR